MNDLCLYTSDGTWLRESSMNLNGAIVTAESVDGIRILANKVVKYMLTSRGSDAFAPDYGSVCMHHKQIARSWLPQLQLEILDDLSKCKKFIMGTETVYTDVNLQDLQLDKLELDESEAIPVIRVHIKIITTDSIYAVLVIDNTSN